tara:strand:+ start:1520 stop:1918 length:399 start_codon:yes stop_codon:yes gene_type:complete
MKITKQFEFSMGHVLHNYAGKCHQLHGHNYQLEVTVESSQLDSSGFVMDFSDLKAIVTPLIDAELDHHFWVYVKDPRARALVDLGARSVAFEPTAENIVNYFAKVISEALPDKITLAQIELYETSTSKAVLR